jgi:hypothetical protein
LFQLPVQVRDDVVDGSGGILDGRIVRRSHERAGALRIDGGTHARKQEEAESNR